MGTVNVEVKLMEICVKMKRIEDHLHVNADERTVDLGVDGNQLRQIAGDVHTANHTMKKLF